MSEGMMFKSDSDSSSKSGAMLEYCGTNLVDQATKGELDPVIGREEEIYRVSQILCRRRKNNPILLGEAGVGKTAIVEGLALAIANKSTSPALYKKTVWSIDMNALVAGTKYRGEFEERMQNLIREIKSDPNIIIFIDEIHTFVGAGNSSSGLDAANILKPSLSRGEIQCIGATTYDEYRMNIEDDHALERRFGKVDVKEPTLENTTEILEQIKFGYESYHKVKYNEDVIDKIIYLADRYITDRHFPDKAIDILDEAGSKKMAQMTSPKNLKNLKDKLETIVKDKNLAVRSQDYMKAAEKKKEQAEVENKIKEIQDKWMEKYNNNILDISVEDVEEVVAKMTGIPVNKLSESGMERLKNVETELQDQVIGQPEAIAQVASALKRASFGITDKDRPIASLLFLGSTGIGKTELAKVLSRGYFPGEESFIRIDMNSYQERIDVTKLIGSPPGYVGYEEGGELTEAVKRNPYSVILLDEIEKGHPDVFNTLLQILDEGYVIDSLGKYINFRNTIIIMTSNIGISKLEQFGAGIGFGKQNVDNVEEVVMGELKKRFKPEFLNRVDEMVIFNRLTEEDCLKITDILLDKFIDKMSESGYTIKINAKVKSYISEKGFDKVYGARPLKRTIVKLIENPITNYMIDNPTKKDITIGFKGGEIYFK